MPLMDDTDKAILNLIIINYKKKEKKDQKKQNKKFQKYFLRSIKMEK